MCNDRSWKSCSIVTIVFTSLLMLGMFIAVGVMNSMFGDNMQCYVDASHEVSSSRRQMFEGMDKIAALHPSGDGIALGKQALINVAQTFGLGPAVSQLPAFRSLAPEGRKLSEWETIPNDNSCLFHSDDGMCDDDITWGLCDCGTDLNDCGYRSSEDCTASPPPPPYTWGGSEPKSDAEKVDEVEKAVLDVFNPCMIIPAIFSALFLYIGSGLTLKDPVQFSCGGKGMFITGSIFAFPSFIIYAIATYCLLVYANVVVEIIKQTFEQAAGDDHVFSKCLDDSRAMFSSAGVGCLIACIACLGAFISSICASCGICKHETALKKAPVQGTQMGNIAVATPVPV